MKSDKRFKELCNLVSWINDLNEEAQLDILNYLTEKDSILHLSDDDTDKFGKLLATLAKLFSTNEDKEQLKEVLEACGLNILLINPLFEYCIKHSQPYIHAKQIRKLKKESLEYISSFVLNKIVLYEEYEMLNPSELAKVAHTDTEQFQNAVTFIYNNYRIVCQRKTSPAALKDLLIQKFEFSEEMANTIVAPIAEKALEAQQAYLLEKVMEISIELAGLKKSKTKKVT